MTTPIKPFYPWIVLLFASGILPAQSPPDLRFNGHTLGESAEEFFTTATTMASHANTREYCKSLLEDPKTKEELQAAGEAAISGKPVVVKNKDFSVLDVSNCRQVTAALNGEKATVGARLAAELGKGVAFFAAGRLSGFELLSDSSYPDTIAELERRFGTPGQKNTVARPGWPTHEEMRWEKDGVMADVWKNEISGGSILMVGYLKSPYESVLRGKIVSAPTQ
jgi:hypothetical protein